MRQIPGGITTLSPLVLEFVKTILRIRPVAVPLRDTQNPFGDIGHQHHIFLDLGLTPVHESKFQLAFFLPGSDQVFLARVETAAQKSSFREPWKHRRCIIPATGFYEWQPWNPPRNNRRACGR